jgi:hypothetical protein
VRILFDHSTPRPLRSFLSGHEVRTAKEMHWENLSNGALLSAAESHFDLLITADQNIQHQQNLQNRTLAILVLRTNRWSEILLHITEVQAAVAASAPGGLRELGW